MTTEELKKRKMEELVPIGIESEKFHVRRRIYELRAAISRYISKEYQIDPLWVDEYNRLIEFYPTIKEGPIFDENNNFINPKKHNP